MYARHASHIGRFVAARRRLLDLRQSDLARHLGVRRQRLIALEQGQPRLDLDLVLKVYDALGIGLDMQALPGETPSWIKDAAWAAAHAKTIAANRPRVRRSRAFLDQLRAKQAAYDVKANEAKATRAADPP